jgi:hypothetical protein
MKRPNFLIIGAARSGSTTLVRCLTLNRRIYIPEAGNEPKFFSREQEYSKGTEFYLRTYFTGADNYDAVGEKSTEYMENQSSAERIFRFDQRMRLICILRHPVERAISNYWWSVFNGLEKRSINEALEEGLTQYLNDPSEIYALSSSRPHAYIDRGLYLRNLKPFYRCFSRENIRCIIFEDFVLNTHRIVHDLMQFLDVPTDNPQAPAIDVEPQRAVPKKDRLDPTLYKTLARFYRTENKGLKELIGSANLEAWDTE